MRFAIHNSVVRASYVGWDMTDWRFGARVFRPLTPTIAWNRCPTSVECAGRGAQASRDAVTAGPLCQDVQ